MALSILWRHAGALKSQSPKCAQDHSSKIINEHEVIIEREFNQFLLIVCVNITILTLPELQVCSSGLHHDLYILQSRVWQGRETVLSRLSE